MLRKVLFVSVIFLLVTSGFLPVIKATVEEEWMAIPPSYSEKYDNDGDGYQDSHKVQIDADTNHYDEWITVHAKGRMYDRYDDTPLTPEIQVDWQISAPGGVNKIEWSPEMHFNIPDGYTPKEGLPYVRIKTFVYLYDDEWNLEQNGDYEYGPWEIRHNLYPPGHGFQSPVAVLSASPTEVEVGQTVTFDGSSSYDPDGGSIVSYYFDFGDSSNSGWIPQSTSPHEYTSIGYYDAKLKVIDDEAQESPWSSIVQIHVIISNTPPVASNLVITPSSPKTTDDLVGSYTYTDAEGHPESGTKIRWYRDGTPEPAYNDQKIVDSVATAKGQTWKFSVEPSDGIDFGDLKWSQEVLIHNTPPTADNPRISPLFPTRKDNLHAKWDYDDVDSDPEVGSEIRWYKRVGDNDVPQPAYNDCYTVPYTATDWLEVWHFTVRPRDGQLLGSLQQSPYVTIGYRHIGALTDQTNDGISAEIEVTDPAVQEGSENFFMAWIMVMDRGSDPDDWKDDSWFQVGWIEHGNLGGPYDPGHQYVFTEEYHGVEPYSRQLYGYSISPGMSIQVKLDHTGTTWAAKLWWNGQWHLLETANMEFSTPPETQQACEVFLAAHSPFYIPDTSFYNVKLLVSGVWDKWDETYEESTNQVEEEPYKANWLNDYWNWYAYYSQVSELNVVAESPVNMLVTDPIGRRIGYDPENATVVNEIPNATYSGPGSEPQNVSILDPLPGSYVVDAFGTGNGSYTIIMESLTSNGSVIDIRGWNGTAALGEAYTENMTLYANGQVAVPYDVAVDNVTLSKTTIGQGYSMNLTVTIQNQGNYMENLSVTLYVDKNTTDTGDEITIETQNVTLASGNSTTVIFTWNTTSVTYGNYTIITIATPVPGETYTVDNTRIDGWVVVTIVGDVSGDGVVDGLDKIIVGIALFTVSEDPLWNPNADITGEGVVDGLDKIIVGIHLFESWP